MTEARQASCASWTPSSLAPLVSGSSSGDPTIVTALVAAALLAAATSVAPAGSATSVAPAGSATAGAAQAPAAPAGTGLESPRLEAGSSSTAVAQFWARIARDGAPLVEPLDAARQLVTFLWRGTDTTRNVRLFWSVRLVGTDTPWLTRLPGTDIWYKTTRLPRGTRLSYQFVPDLDVAAGQSRDALRRAILAGAQPDPLNSRQWSNDPSAGGSGVASILELDGAPRPSWQPLPGPRPAGALTWQRVTSATLDNTRDVAVVRPADAGRTTARPWRLLVLLDGESYARAVDVPAMLAALAADGRIAPTMAVLVANATSTSRADELTANPRFTRFLADELLPWIRARHPVSAAARDVIVAGSSYGGLAATAAALERPDAFGNVISLSGSFWWAPERDAGPPASRNPFAEANAMAQRVIAWPRRDVRFYLAAGLLEAGTTDEGSGILDTTRHLRDVLRLKGHDAIAREFAGGHDYLAWIDRLADGLVALDPH
ncbi:MAG: hypothetical protein ABS36_07140 [Acidobacteria bacterium SCN 69-37]|nr:MAG: hypothetical protein ABS36_07140 [Acidobacteria bacterium SCN 69-37]